MSRTSNKKMEIYEFIRNSASRGEYPPSVREIAKAVNLSSPATVYAHLTKLKDEGKIEMTGGKKRSVRLVEKGKRAGRRDGVPVVGAIAAGDPILMDEYIEGYVSDQVYRTEGAFGLKVRGDSMSGAGVLDGDIVIIHPTNKVENGDIAAVRVDDEATVKRVYYEKDAVRLVPENPNYREVMSKDAHVIGKVIAVIRYYA